MAQHSDALSAHSCWADFRTGKYLAHALKILRRQEPKVRRRKLRQTWKHRSPIYR